MGRALRNLPSRLRPRGYRFNPRPSCGTGATRTLASITDGDLVSILARPVGRALPASASSSPPKQTFQSSPVLWDGRYNLIFWTESWSSRFNPRPSCGTGATSAPPSGCPGPPVSILARPVGRALQWEMFDDEDDAECVSILARPVGRALLTAPHADSRDGLFQSSPVLWDGRYPSDEHVISFNCGFNPRPSCGTGATISQLLQKRRYSVSILARPVGRALHQLRFLRFRVCCFNPRPSCGTGATRSRQVFIIRSLVSILARPVGRALQADILPAIKGPTGFNPRPSCGTGATVEEAE